MSSAVTTPLRDVEDAPPQGRTATRSLGTILGTTVTIGVHAWRRNAVLSILAGTATCLLIVNAL